MENYFKVDPKIGISQFQVTVAYLGGSTIQTVVDNPVTAYRQLVQQYARNAQGEFIDPKVASSEANAVFKKNPFSSSLSGLVPRLAGVLVKRIPKFTSALGISFLVDGVDKDLGVVAATGASIVSAPFINPVRMVEKQQRVDLRTTGKIKPVLTIIRESAAKNFRPLFRGTVPLMGHSLASALLGLVGQPRLQKHIEREVHATGMFGRVGCNLIASSIVSPIYVAITNPLSRLEVIMQTSSISQKRVSTTEAIRELFMDAQKFGIRGIFRGNMIGVGKAIISLSLFHEGRIACTDGFKWYNQNQNHNAG